MPYVTESEELDGPALFHADGTLTLEGQTVRDFLNDVDFSAVFEELGDEAVIADEVLVVEDDEGLCEIDLTDEGLSVLCALMEARRYKPMTRAQVMRRMRSARTQTGVEKIRNRKAKLYRRRNRSRLAIKSTRRQVRVGTKAARAAKMRGLTKEGEDAGEMEDVLSLAVPADMVEEIAEDLEVAGLDEGVTIEDPGLEEGDELGEYTSIITGPPGVVEGIAAYLSGVEVVDTQEISPELLAAGALEAIDMDDLGEMFVDYLDDLAEDADTIEEKAVVAAWADAFDMTEAAKPKHPWKKGDFRKMHKGAVKTAAGRTGPEMVNSMLGAMIDKEAIKRAGATAPQKPLKGKRGFESPGIYAKGTGYKKGDYVKAAGYGGGSPKGYKQWTAFVNTSLGLTAKKALAKATGKKQKEEPEAKKPEAKKPEAKKPEAKKPVAGAKKVSSEVMAKLKKVAAAAAAAAAKIKGKKGAKAEGEEDAFDLTEGVDVEEGENGPEKMPRSLEGAGMAAAVAARMNRQAGAPTASILPSRAVDESIGLLAGPGVSGPTLAARLMNRGAPCAAGVTDAVSASQVMKTFLATLPEQPGRLSEVDFGMLYSPRLDEHALRALAKDAGFRKVTTSKVAHPDDPALQLVFLRDRMVISNP